MTKSRFSLRKPTFGRRLACLFVSLLAPAGTLAEPPSRAPFAEVVPANVGLYAELTQAPDLLRALTDPQLWTMLGTFAGQAAEPTDTVAWREQIIQTVGMGPEQAIDQLLAQGVAFAGTGLFRSQDALVVTRPAEQINVPNLLAQLRRATPDDRPPLPYTPLRSGLGVVPFERRLVFGDPRPPNGLFKDLLAMQRGGPPLALAVDPIYQSLLARVAPDPDGLLFVRLGGSQEPPKLTPDGQRVAPPTHLDSPPPAPPMIAGMSIRTMFLHASAVMLALHRDGDTLQLTGVSNGYVLRPDVEGRLEPTLARLPAETLAGWAFRVDYNALGKAIARLPSRHILQLARNLQPASDTPLSRLVANEFYVALGSVEQAPRTGVVEPRNVPELPAIAIVLPTQHAATVTNLSQLIRTARSAYNLIALRQGGPLLEPIEQTPRDDGTLHSLDLAPLVARLTDQVVRELELAWAAGPDHVVIATHRLWLDEVLASLDQPRAETEPASVIGRHREPRLSTQAGFVHTGRLADLADDWLNFWTLHYTAINDERWWRDRQPPAARPRLGIQVKPVQDASRLLVTAVEPAGPGAGFLEVGDFLVGVEQQRFENDPIAAVRKALVEREHAKWIEVHVERNGQELRVNVPLPFVNPIQILERFVALGKFVETVRYADDHADPAGPRAYLSVSLNAQALRRANAPDGVAATSTDGEATSDESSARRQREN